MKLSTRLDRRLDRRAKHAPISFLRPFATLMLIFVSAHAFSHGNAAPTTKSDRSIDFPDVEGYQTLVVDLHTHSVFSDGHVWPKIRVEEALRDGLDGLAITEHLEYQPHRADIIHPDRNRAFEDASASAKDSDILIIPGAEITRDAPAGHMNAVFINDANKLLNDDNAPEDQADVLAYYAATKEWPAQSAVDAAHAQGAFVFWNHPYWSRQQPDGLARMNDFHRKNAKAGKLHGIEIANGQNYSEEAHAIALKHDLAFIGVSDVHDLIDWDHPPAEGEHRPVNLVFSRDRSLEGIKEALFAKRTVVWFRNLLIGREDSLMPLLAASISVGSATYREGTQVLEVDIQNHSDATLKLQNRRRLLSWTQPMSSACLHTA
ncbi:MAG: PHP domain-containing protein [Pseudomonadales bacterium]|nr:PHP domain-containing protein [Pseudomonadales bacterium]